jgi:hypothetical protein
MGHSHATKIRNQGLPSSGPRSSTAAALVGHGKQTPFKNL